MSPPQVSPYLCWNDGRRFLCIPGGGAVLRLELTEKAALNLLADLATSFGRPGIGRATHRATSHPKPPAKRRRTTRKPLILQ
jgi:hypothetical protein